MKQASTFVLKLAVVIIGLPVLALCVLLLPKIGMEAIEQFTNGTTLASIVLGILFMMYVSTIPFYTALYQTMKLLRFIDNNQAFSDLSVKALRKIKNCAITISVLYLIALPFVSVIAQWDDAPGLLLIGIIIAGASMVIAIFAAVLQRLLHEAIQMKLENDLTV